MRKEPSMQQYRQLTGIIQREGTGLRPGSGAPLRSCPHLVPGGGASLDRKTRWLATSESFSCQSRPCLPSSAPSSRPKWKRLLCSSKCLPKSGSRIGWYTVKPWEMARVPYKYLARYLFRVALANSRILACQNGVVTLPFPNKKPAPHPKCE